MISTISPTALYTTQEYPFGHNTSKMDQIFKLLWEEGEGHRLKKHVDGLRPKAMHPEYLIGRTAPGSPLSPPPPSGEWDLCCNMSLPPARHKDLCAKRFCAAGRGGRGRKVRPKPFWDWEAAYLCSSAAWCCYRTQAAAPSRRLGAVLMACGARRGRTGGGGA